MSSFVFNEFKKRYINGEVPSADTWHFIPVNEKFKNTYTQNDVELNCFRTIDDFKQTDSTLINYNTNNGEITALSGTGLLSGYKINHKWYKVSDDDNLSNQPMFVNEQNYDKFLQYYSNNIKGNKDYIDNYITSGGFYYIRSKDELTWFANYSNNSDNTIIGVLGDNIEGVINNEPIGKDENYPFQGVLDGNGYSLKDITIICDSTDNGIVGVLGVSGEVRNFRIVNKTDLICTKKINLTHIKEDARDVNAGILVGRNYGKVSHIESSGLKFQFSGFVPEVYSVTNKSDNYTWSDGLVRKKFDDNNENFFYLNSYCINSPGNVCPYVGYFAEGYYGEDSYSIARQLNFNSKNHNKYKVHDSDSKSNFTKSFHKNNNDYYISAWLDRRCGRWCLNHENPSGIISSGDYKNCAIQLNDNGTVTAFNYYNFNFYSYDSSATDPCAIELDSFTYTSTSLSGNNEYESTYKELYNLEDTTIKNKVLRYAKSPVYYGVDSLGNLTCGLLYGYVQGNQTSGFQKDEKGDSHYASIPTSGINMCYNTNLIAETVGINEYTCCPSAYCQTSLRMHPIARAAYNVGVIVGANYGDMLFFNFKKLQIKNTSNFVGFLGTLAGKLCNGGIARANIDVYYKLNYTGTDESYKVAYNCTPLLPNSVKNKILRYNETLEKDKDPDGNIDPEDSEEHIEDDLTKPCNLTALFEDFNSDSEANEYSIVYDLKPIFVVGGYIGRYVPEYRCNYEVDNNKNTKAIEDVAYINESTISYKDNFNKDKTDKRIENAFGAIVGKIDYATDAAGVKFEIFSANNPALHLNYCKIYAPVVGRSYYYTPITGTGPYGLDTAHSGMCNNKYVGVNEVKFNSLNSINLLFADKFKESKLNQDTDEEPLKTHNSYPGPHPTCGIINWWKWFNQSNGDTENKYLKKYNIRPSTEILEGSAANIMYTTDYSFTTNYLKFGPEASFWLNANVASEQSPEFVANLGLNTPYGLSQENIAQNLLKINCCSSNVCPITIMYDNFISTAYQDRRNFPYNEHLNNDINNLHSKKGWVSGNSAGDIYNNKQTNLTPNGIAGLQCTFDGYTFIDYDNRPSWNDTVQDVKQDKKTEQPMHYKPWIEKLKPTDIEGWILDKGQYNNPRRFIKSMNIVSNNWLYLYNEPNTALYNIYPMWPINYYNNDDTINAVINSEPADFKPTPREEISDQYYYYSYNDSASPAITYNNMIPLSATFVQSEKVEFNLPSELVTKMGYEIKIPNDRKTFYKDYYSVGEHLDPLEIRNRINNEKTHTFNTTSISSEDSYGGLYVIDSKGNNVMFLDNMNNTELNGNVVTYPATSSTDGLMILEVE